MFVVYNNQIASISRHHYLSIFWKCPEYIQLVQVYSNSVYILHCLSMKTIGVTLYEHIVGIIAQLCYLFKFLLKRELRETWNASLTPWPLIFSQKRQELYSDQKGLSSHIINSISWLSFIQNQLKWYTDKSEPRDSLATTIHIFSEVLEVVF